MHGGSETTRSMTLDHAPRRDFLFDVRVAPATRPARVCCYTTDEGYLLPTLLSASQARDALPRDVADVLVLCFGTASAATSAAAEFCAEAGLEFYLVPSAALDGNPMICARFFLSQFVPAKYREILYLDGDTQVDGSLAPLLSHPVAPGRILAVPDPMAVMIGSADGPWPARRAYFRSIGLSDPQQGAYFNSGVMRFRAADWEAVSRECLALCRREGARFKFRDQDALNLVVGLRGVPVSFRWNFPLFFLNFGAEAAIRPRIYHFMSNPRPWHGAFAPWGGAWHTPYKALAAARPELARTLKPMRGLQYGRYVVQQRVKRFRESRTWGTPAVRARIDAMEARAVV